MENGHGEGSWGHARVLREAARLKNPLGGHGELAEHGYDERRAMVGSDLARISLEGMGGGRK